MADKSYQTLEHQIAQIHRLLEGMVANVTWNTGYPTRTIRSKRGKSIFRYDEMGG
jgi:hypothetical protein